MYKKLFPNPPVLDLIDGLGTIFNQPESFGTITENTHPAPYRPPLSGDYEPLWNDAAGQQNWLDRWDIRPSPDTRYLPTFPQQGDTSIGADIRRA